MGWPFLATFLLALLALALSRQLVTRLTASLAFFGVFVSYYGVMWARRAAALRETLPRLYGRMVAEYRNFLVHHPADRDPPTA